MKNTPVYFLVVLMILLVSCKDTSQHKPLVTPVQESQFPINIQKGGTFTSLGDIRKQAEAIINFRKDKEPKAMAFLTYAFWYPEVAFNNGEFTQVDQFQGYWLKLNDDFTYIFGYYDTAHGSGRYHFRLDDMAMVMLDDNPAFEPKSWKVQHNGEAMVLVGQHEMDVNNGMQIKFLPLDRRPTRG